MRPLPGSFPWLSILSGCSKHSLFSPFLCPLFLSFIIAHTLIYCHYRCVYVLEDWHHTLPPQTLNWIHELLEVRFYFIDEFLLISQFFNFIIFLLLFKYSFVPFPRPLPTTPVLSTSLTCFHPPCYCPCVLYNCSCKPFTLFPCNSLPFPLWSLSACSLFQCLWLYFACLFILLIRFLLKVRLYGICLLRKTQMETYTMFMHQKN